MNLTDTEIDLCRELAGMLYPYSPPGAIEFSISDLLEILRERGYKVELMVWPDGDSRVVLSRQPRKGETLKPCFVSDNYEPTLEALLRAAIAVLSEEKKDTPDE